jgi:hypothetical protein
MFVAMLRKHASLIVAMCLIALVTTACIVTTRRPPAQRGQPVYVEKQKKPKHEKHKEPKHEKHKKHKD